MKKLTTIGLSLALVLVIAAPVLADNVWEDYHWARTANPFTLKLGDNVSGAWDAHLATASSDWGVSPVLNTSIVAGGTNKLKGRLTPKNCIPTLGRVEVCNAHYGANGWLGLAQIWFYSTGHIAQGVVKNNDSYTMNEAKKLHVMCQEIGHIFGLDHQSTGESSLDTCMDYYDNTSDTDFSSTKPNQHDYGQLATMYSHLDGTTTIASLTNKVFGLATAFAAKDEAGNSEWGTAIHNDPKGRADTFQKNLGNGEKLITHVIWAN